MKTRYLIDSNILMHNQRGYFDLDQYLADHKISIKNCFISEITKIELGVGEILLKKKGYKFKISTEDLISSFDVLPISNVIPTFIEEKCRLQLEGTPIENNFDLLIGCTALVNDMVMVTENTKDFRNLKGIKLENWFVRKK